MQPNTQSQNLKVCNSCKRPLHLSYFGITRKSKDGFNDCCKECRNYRRRKFYHQSSGNEQFILPLDENNRSVLNEVLGKSSKMEIPCLCMTSNQNLTFIIEKMENSYRFEFFNDKSNDKDIFYTGYAHLFVDISLKMLRQRNLRLFLPQQSHLIWEWKSK